MNTNDVAILRIEPLVFLDAASHATLLRSGSDGAVAGTTLTSASADFVADGIDAGHVVVISGPNPEVLEVTARLSATSLAVSRPRANDEAASVAPAPGTALAYEVRTFQRIREQETAWVLGTLGVDEDPASPGPVATEARVARLIAMRVVRRAYELAQAASPLDESIARRAATYARLAARVRHQTSATVDFGGGGSASGSARATRRTDVITFTRR